MNVEVVFNMDNFIFHPIFALFSGLVIFFVYKKFFVKFNHNKKVEAILHFAFPPAVIARFSKNNPSLSPEDVSLVFSSLAEYFAACYIYLNSSLKRKNGYGLGMPSKIVDEAWHSFLLFSKEYEKFSKKYFGKMLHHTPDDDFLASSCHVGSEIKESEQVAPGEFKQSVLNLFMAFEGLRIRGDVSYSSLPLIFTIDEKLSIPDGFLYKTSDAELMRVQSMKKNGSASGSGSACSGCFTDSGKGSSSEGSSGSSCSSCGGD